MLTDQQLRYARRQLTRLVDGAVADTFTNHPEYLTKAGQRRAAGSLRKRLVGLVMGYVVQTTQGRSGVNAPAATSRPGTVIPPPAPADGLIRGPSLGGKSRPGVCNARPVIDSAAWTGREPTPLEEWWLSMREDGLVL